MTRALPATLLVLLATTAACAVGPGKSPNEIVDPAVAAEDPDFHVQGEYVGEAVVDGKKHRLGAQVVALSGGGFDVYLLEGGLPGDGWKKGDDRQKVSATCEDGVTRFENEQGSGEIRDGRMTLNCKESGAKLVLERVERASPTLGDKPPKGAVVVFGGGVKDFDHVVLSKEGNLVAGTTTKNKFDSYQLHLEFRLSWKPAARGQARSNSGMYLHDCYEVQVLDSFGLDGKDNECGGLYKIKEPDVNMCLPPLVWQTYDVELTAPKYDAEGKKTTNARLTLKHNGVTIHDDVELPHGTPGRAGEGPGPRPFHLQGHGNHVQYRNVWLVPK